MVLPTEMTAPSGATLPLSFGGGDAAVMVGTAGTLEVFDPNAGTAIRLNRTANVAFLYLGGSAVPPADQAAGAYSANITVLVARN